MRKDQSGLLLMNKIYVILSNELRLKDRLLTVKTFGTDC